METLPIEIVEKILSSPVLSIRDVVHFGSVNSKFNKYIFSNSYIWRIKYFQRWPKTDNNIDIQDWLTEIIARTEFECNVSSLLAEMSYTYHSHQEIDIEIMLPNVKQLMLSHKFSYLYLKDCLQRILDLPKPQSLTEKYYAKVLLKYIITKHYDQDWKHMMSFEPQQTLEKGPIFVSNWFQENGKDISATIVNHLNYMSETAKEHLLFQNKNHPIKDVPKEMLLQWQSENLSDNMFKPEDCVQIIKSINYILFDYVKFNILTHLNPRQYDINFVFLIHCATPLMFAVIYESVARRLGVKIEVLEFSDHCLIQWKENYRSEKPRSHYISMRDKGSFVKTGRCPASTNASLFYSVKTPCNMLQIAQRCALGKYRLDIEENYLSKKHALELLLLLMPHNFEWYEELGRLQTSAKTHVDLLIEKILMLGDNMSDEEWYRFQSLVDFLQDYQVTELKNEIESNIIPRYRSEDIKFAVGLTVRLDNFSTNGVIYGWDYAGVSGHEPVYKILCDDSKSRRLSQKDIKKLHLAPSISHHLIGRYFEEHKTNFYKANTELQSEYPQDTEALSQLIKNDQGQVAAKLNLLEL